MQDHELKKLLQECHPVRPGQEERAWKALQARLAKPQPRLARFLVPDWRGAAIGFAALAAISLSANVMLALNAGAPNRVSADSQAPGIYATAFYSRSAHAQVVWLNGMAPANDHPTYLDPTSALPAAKASDSAGDPNNL